MIIKKKIVKLGTLQIVLMISSLSVGSVESLNGDVMRIQIFASLPSQREGRVKAENRSPPSPDGTAVVFVDRHLEKHITPVTLKSNIKQNPLYMAIKSMDGEDNEKFKPSWTVKEYDTQTIHGNLTSYLKVIYE